MCGRYLIDEEVYADMWMMLNSESGIRNSGLVGEVFPTNIAPVLTRGGAADFGVHGYKWGFPHWKGAGVIINARAETALERKMFSKPLLEQRCVIPSSGYYEWSGAGGGKKKNKYLLRLPGERVLFMAGMVSIFRDDAGCEYGAFVILTTAANDSVAPIHDRMPVILARDERGDWLNDDRFMEHVLRRPGPGLIPLDAEALLYDAHIAD